MTKTFLRIQLLPSRHSIAEDEGLDVYDEDSDDEMIGFLQSAGIDEVQLEPGETLVIPAAEFESGCIDCEGTTYRLIKKNIYGQDEITSSADKLTLEPGSYRFELDQKTVTMISRDIQS